MANLSWLFYKGYYIRFDRWLEIDSKDKGVKKVIAEFFEKQNEAFYAYTQRYNLTTPGKDREELKTTYPGLLFGSGYTHETGAAGELKIGLQLDYTTGQPVIPGSSVKGALRAVFPQFEKDDKQPWKIKDLDKETGISIEKALYVARLLSLPYEGNELYEKVHELELHIFEGLDVDKSREKGTAVYHSIYNRDIFHDAFPVKGGEGNKIFGPDSITPHTKGPLKEPVPLLFLKVLPKVTYAFNYQLNAPAWENTDAIKRKMLYKEILTTTGLGAKTNVGYGQFNA
ncbi:MAG: type III-B CRISPR module RAMP protein Cmr6 [Chitinophagaceae bacterium]|nr:type III-B CRISPR module RAMP protein Cmr6 [Chitinophagaceae bacterium]